jgi:hypothetical protein
MHFSDIGWMTHVVVISTYVLMIKDMSEKRPNDIDVGHSDKLNDTCHSDINLYPNDRGWVKEDLMI